MSLARNDHDVCILRRPNIYERNIPIVITDNYAAVVYFRWILAFP